MVRPSRSVLAAASLVLLGACAVQSRPRSLASPAAAPGAGSLDPGSAWIAGVTIGSERLMFDPAPIPRVTGDTIYARVGGESYVIPRAAISVIWMARPGEPPYAVSPSDDRAVTMLWKAAPPRPAPAPAGAPGPVPPLALAPGMRVRVDTVTDAAFVYGRLVRLSGDTVVVADGGRERSFVLNSHRRLWIPTGKRAHTVAGAAVGLPVGILAGTLTYSPPRPVDCTGNPFCVTRAEHAVTEFFGRAGQALLFGFVGAGLGALIGSAIHTTVWTPVSPAQLARLQVVVAPLPADRLGLGLAVRF